MSLDENSIPVEEEVTREIVRVLRMGAAFQAALHGLHSKLELPAVLDEQERMRLAAAYDATAGTLRARAGAGGKREFFEAALVDDRGVRPPVAGSAGEHLGFVQSILRGVLGRLGAVVEDAGGVHVLPFALSMTETADGVLISAVAGAPGAQPRVSFSGAPPAPGRAAPAAPSLGTPPGGAP
jgi:hypothetical protein